ncbi:MAG: hypothetical protein HRU09_02340 [Oligoflexales bacterium]|nr:hypothetical protein [Oligoflexales bacterium]
MARRFLKVLILMLHFSCTTPPNPTFQEAVSRVGNDFQTKILREYFETKGIPASMTPKMSLIKAYEQEFTSSDPISLEIQGQSLIFSMGYKIEVLILKPSRDQSFLEKMKTIFPFFKQDQAATLCLYKNYLKTKYFDVKKINLFGSPLKSDAELENLSSIYLTSDLLWVGSPDKPDIHVRSCFLEYQKGYEEAAHQALMDYKVNLSLAFPAQSCTLPDSRARLRNKLIRDMGDPSCLDWFRRIQVPQKQQVLARCLPLDHTNSKLGLCRLRAKAKTPVPFFLDERGSLSPFKSSRPIMNMTAPSTVQYLCDESLGSTQRIKKYGGWFRYFHVECEPPKAAIDHF